MPKVGAAACVLFGIVAFASLLASGTKVDEARVGRGGIRPEMEQVLLRSKVEEPKPSPQLPAPVANPNPSVKVQPPAQVVAPAERIEEQVTYCGAETRKGTACMRRVKGKGRCFQHVGMPLMAAVSGTPASKTRN